MKLRCLYNLYIHFFGAKLQKTKLTVRVYQNFFENFKRQVKDPTRFEFFRVPAEKFQEVVKKLQEAFQNPDRPKNDIIVDNEKQVLHVKIHRTDHWADDKILVNLCKQLNQTQTIFPGSNLTLFYNLATD